MVVRVALCGPLRLEIAGAALEDRVQGRKGRLAFAYLVLHRDRTVSRDELMGAIWDEDDEAPTAPDAALSTILSRLRTAVAPARLAGRDQLTLELGDDCEVDLESAQRATASAADALAAGRPGHAAATARSALAVLDRPFLPGVNARWAEERRREQQALRVLALETVGRSALELGGAELAAAERAARELVEVEPYRESGHALLMRAHAAQGNVAEALRVYHDLREFLREELGVAPAPEVTALNERLLTGDAEAQPPAPVVSARPDRAHLSRNRSPESPFVGRATELARLIAHLEAALDGGSRLVVLSGEPGIGKTRLVEQLMDAAGTYGARVLYGGGDADAVLSYQPVAEALDAYVSSAAGEMRAAGLGAELAELARLLPDIGVEQPPDSFADPDVQRYRLFQSVAATFAHAASDRPLVLVLDDLQWADRSTREMLSHLLRAAEVPRSLVVVVHREEGAGALASAAKRYRAVDHIELGGLGRHECRALVLAHIPQAADPVVERLIEQTAGNPFFLEELLRSIDDGATIDDGEVPPGVRAVVVRRLERLGDETLKVLRAAAVAGHDFDLGVLDRALTVGTDVVLDAVESALTAGLLVEDGEHPDRFSFSHALVRGTVYGGQSASRRMRLHLAVGGALEAIGGSHAAELGNHFFQARYVGGAARAVRHLTAAGRLADEALAWEDAARHYDRALEAHELEGERDGRGELLLALGDASEHSGDSARAKQVFLEAAELARARGDAQLLSQAALGYGRAPGAAFGADPVLLGLLEEARAALGDRDRALRARVLGRLAVERASAGDDADALSEDAVRLAEESRDDVVLAVALASRHWTLARPEMLEERCAVARHSLDLAIRAGDRERELAGREWWLFDLLELGDLAAVEEQLARYDALAGSFRHPSYGGYSLAMHAMLALLRGEHAAAESLIDEAHDLLSRALDPDASRVYALQRFVLHLQQREEPLAAQALDAVASDRPIWACLQAWAWSEHGDHERAERGLGDLARIPRDDEWLVTMCALAHVASGTGDARLAAHVAGQLAPFADRVAAVAGIVCLGSIAHPLGRVTRMLGDTAEGDRLLRIALERNRAMGALPAAERVERELTTTALRKGGT